MFCGECGTQNPDTNQFCKNCGIPLKRVATATASQTAPAMGASPLTPPGNYVPPPQAPLVAGNPVVAKQPWSKGLLLLGIGSLLVGGASWFVYPYICGILAIILGGVVLFKSRKKRVPGQ